MKRIISAVLFASWVIFGQSALGGFVEVDLSTYANARIQNYQPSASGYPEGPVTLGGIPFNIQAVGGNNAWNAEFVAGPIPTSSTFR